MQFLLDANCFTEIVRSRPQADVVRRLLSDVPGSELAISDFALHSLGIVMRRHAILDQFPILIRDVDFGGNVAVVSLKPAEMTSVVDVCKTYNLDFDDAYQYATAELHSLRIVSLDSDFDRTPRGRLDPLAALTQYQTSQKQNP
jgi:uncharacterized protein